MSLFFLTYDLRSTRDYGKLYDELKRFNAIRMLESTWCFNRVNTNAVGLRDRFRQFVDADDGLLVDESFSWAAFNTGGTPKGL